MLVFPERVLRGDIPNRDFLHLYGPGSLWALAGAFKVFGVSLLTERVFALFQQLAIVAGVYLLARRWNRTLATVGAVVSSGSPTSRAAAKSFPAPAPIPAERDVRTHLPSDPINNRTALSLPLMSNVSSVIRVRAFGARQLTVTP